MRDKTNTTELTSRQWTGAECGLVELIDRGVVLRLEDRRKGEITTLRSAEPIVVDIRLGYELSLLWRGNDFVECRAQIGVGAVDASGAILREFWGKEQISCEWLSASVRVAATAWPEGTVGAVVLLRAKTNPETTGCAYFRNR